MSRTAKVLYLLWGQVINAPTSEWPHFNQGRPATPNHHNNPPLRLLSWWGWSALVVALIKLTRYTSRYAFCATIKMYKRGRERIGQAQFIPRLHCFVCCVLI